MKSYWDTLQARERLLVIFSASALLLLTIYLVIIEPYLNERQRLYRSVQIQQETLQWMKETAPLLKEKNLPGSRSGKGQSLMSAIDQSVRKSNLNQAIKKIQPEGKRVRIQFSQVSFDSMLAWLAQVEKQLGYRVDGMVVERLDKPGQVNARIVIGDNP